jgi:hypothetical protein
VRHVLGLEHDEPGTLPLTFTTVDPLALLYVVMKPAPPWPAIHQIASVCAYAKFIEA